RFESFFQKILSELDADRRAVYRKNATKICLNENTDRITAERCGQPARRSSDAALPAESNRSGSRADGTFLRALAGCVFDGGKNVFFCDIPPTNIVQKTVIGFRHQRIDRLYVLITRQGEHIIEQKIGDPRNGEG